MRCVSIVFLYLFRKVISRLYNSIDSSTVSVYVLNVLSHIRERKLNYINIVASINYKCDRTNIL